MSNDTLFRNASREKYRFPSLRGFITVEDLWDLSLSEIDATAVRLNDSLQKARQQVSFVARKTVSARAEQELENKLEIVKAIIALRLEEADKAKQRSAKAGARAFLVQLRDKKRMEKLESLEITEIDAQIAAMDADTSEDEAETASATE